MLADFTSFIHSGASVAAVAAATAVWLVAVAIVYLRRRPARPSAGPPTLDLGPEPPAVANFLVHDFRVTREAVPATLIDLAARGGVSLEERGVGSYVCRLHGTHEGGLAPYEERVMALLERRASGGVVPAQALTTGPSQESKRWWRDFQREVMSDSQSRGLSREIMDAKTFAWLSVAAIAPALLVGVFVSENAGFGYWVVALFLLGAVRARHPQRETPAGLAAAAHWLGVRDKLETDEVFSTLPPIAVTLWERLLAYGAAFGVARGAVQAIPMGAESDHRAWSSYSGRWRVVDIRYPQLYPPGWGMHPLGVLLRAVPLAVASVFVLRVVAPVALDAFPHQGRLRVVAVLVVLPAVVGVGAAVMILRAVADLWSTRDVTGQILRLRARGAENDEKRLYVAVDDGRSSTIRAWRVKSELYSPLAQDQIVTATLTRRLRYVRSIQDATAAQRAPAHPSGAQSAQGA